MSKLNISRLTNENEDGSPYISGISTFSSTAFLVPPSGTTAQRPEFVKPGMIRFNTDGAHLEYYNGVEWTEVLVANNSLDGGNRGLFGGGGTNPAGPRFNVIDYVTISSTGNATDFGDLTEIKTLLMSHSSSTRGVWGGGKTPATTNTIDYVTIASLGNAVDFGDMTISAGERAGCSNSVRGLFGGGTNVIDYVTIASTGDAIDFGDLLTLGYQFLSACSSPLRGIFAGGGDAPTTILNSIEFVTIATTGNATDFGDLTVARICLEGLSDAHGGLGD